MLGLTGDMAADGMSLLELEYMPFWPSDCLCTELSFPACEAAAADVVCCCACWSNFPGWATAGAATRRQKEESEKAIRLFHILSQVMACACTMMCVMSSKPQHVCQVPSTHRCQQLHVQPTGVCMLNWTVRTDNFAGLSKPAHALGP